MGLKGRGIEDPQAQPSDDLPLDDPTDSTAWAARVAESRRCPAAMLRRRAGSAQRPFRHRRRNPTYAELPLGAISVRAAQAPLHPYYLKQWTTTDRRLCEYKLVPGGYGVKPRRTSPDGTGYQIDLYRVDGVSGRDHQDFEKRFMHLVDTDASRALEKIIVGETDNWSGNLRSGWTRFILSLLFRNPEAVTTIKGHIVEMWDEGIKALQADYAARRRAGDPESFEEFLAKHEPSAAQIGAANFSADVIDNAQVGKTVFEMKWSRVDLSKSNHELLTSDRPIGTAFGIGRSQGLHLAPGFAAHPIRRGAQPRLGRHAAQEQIPPRSPARTTSASSSRRASLCGALTPRSSPSPRSISASCRIAKS